MKAIFLTPIFLGLLAGAADCARQPAHLDDFNAAAQIKPFAPLNHATNPADTRTVIEADLLSLHVCQGSHKMFAAEPSAAETEGLVDAQGAAECVVELQSALREIPATHPEYSDIRAELDWWNRELLELDPVDYHRLNS